MLPLVIQIEKTKERTAETCAFAQSPVRIGRNPLNDIELDDGYVSQWHGVIRFDETHTTYLDLGSTNPSVVDGKPVERNVEVAVTENTDLRIGSFRLHVIRADAPPELFGARRKTAFARTGVGDATSVAATMFFGGEPTKLRSKSAMHELAASNRLIGSLSGPPPVAQRVPPGPEAVTPTAAHPPLISHPPPLSSPPRPVASQPPPMLERGALLVPPAGERIAPPAPPPGVDRQSPGPYGGLSSAPPPILERLAAPAGYPGADRAPGGPPPDIDPGIGYPSNAPPGSPPSAAGGSGRPAPRPSGSPPPLPPGGSGPSRAPMAAVASQPPARAVRHDSQPVPAGSSRDGLQLAYEHYRAAWRTLLAELRYRLERAQSARRSDLLDELVQEYPDIGRESEFRMLVSELGLSPLRTGVPEMEDWLRRLTDNMFPPPNASINVALAMERIGEVLEVFATAFVEMREAHGRFCDEMSLDRPAADSILQTTKNPRLALAYLLNPSAEGASKVEELARSMADFALHQVALVSAVVEGARDVLSELSPDAIDPKDKRKKRGLLAGLFSNEAAARWQRYRDVFSEMIDEDRFTRRLFARPFARKYYAIMGGRRSFTPTG